MNDAPTKGYEREKNLSRDNYLTEAYFSLEQLWSFIEQIYRVRSRKPEKMIEVGVGNGFVATFLKTTGMDVLTCDINPELQPDVLAPVGELDQHVAPGEYDLISCCEVLEHIPFEEFESTIETFAKLSPELFLTLPQAGRTLGISGLFMKSWGRRWFSAWFHVPSKRYPLPSMHFWEVGWNKEHRVSALIAILKKYYRNVETHDFKQNPYHRYFLCTQSKSLDTRCPASPNVTP